MYYTLRAIQDKESTGSMEAAIVVSDYFILYTSKRTDSDTTMDALVLGPLTALRKPEPESEISY